MPSNQIECQSYLKVGDKLDFAIDFTKELVDAAGVTLHTIVAYTIMTKPAGLTIEDDQINGNRVAFSVSTPTAATAYRVEVQAERSDGHKITSQPYLINGIAPATA